MLTEDLLNELCEDNLKFMEEVEEYKMNAIVRNIIEMYQQRFEQTNEQSRKSKEISDNLIKLKKGMPPPPLI